MGDGHCRSSIDGDCAGYSGIVVALDIAYALLSGSIFVPVLAALFWKKVTANITMAAMFVSAGVVIVDLAVEGITSLNAIIYELISCFLVMGLGVFLASRRKDSMIEQDHLKGI